MPEGSRWPVHADGDPYVFVLQLRLEELPMPIGGRTDGLLQMFVRREDLFDPCAPADDESQFRWRLVPSSRLDEPEALVVPDEVPSCKPRRITRTRLVADWPAWDDRERLEERIGSISDDLFDAYMELNHTYHDDDKIGGYPRWVQDETIPSCPDCANPMTYFLQLFDWEDDAVWWTGDGQFYAFVCDACHLRFHAVVQC